MQHERTWANHTVYGTNTFVNNEIFDTLAGGDCRAFWLLICPFIFCFLSIIALIRRFLVLLSHSLDLNLPRLWSYKIVLSEKNDSISRFSKCPMMTYVYIQTYAVVRILTLVRQRKTHDVIIESQISPKKEVSLGGWVNKTMEFPTNVSFFQVVVIF